MARDFAVLKFLVYIGAAVALAVPVLFVIGALTHLRSRAYRLALGLSAGTLLIGYLALWIIAGKHSGRGLFFPVGYGLVPCALLVETGIAMRAAMASPIRYLGLPLALAGLWLGAQISVLMLR